MIGTKIEVSLSPCPLNFSRVLVYNEQIETWSDSDLLDFYTKAESR